ncbi:MAG: ribonuclease PH [Christensenellaceae bacterium]|nr:ribonuclease PH [Christensenellaceae bacterium]
MRINNRLNNIERNCIFEIGFTKNAYSSCLVRLGETVVLVTCSIENKVPSFLKDSGSGWLTAEYSMLPGSTNTRKPREFLKKDGRSSEIQRLIGRSLRQAIDLNILGEYTITIDCDVIQADGGTRTASINGAYVALVVAVDRMIKENKIKVNPLKEQISALSVGILNEKIILDLCYEEDSQASADVNIVMNNNLEFIEIQGTGEKSPIKESTLFEMIKIAKIGLLRIQYKQREALKSYGISLLPKPFLIVSSRNQHKVIELAKIFGKSYKLFSLNDINFEDDIIENGKTFEENSTIKADFVRNNLGLPVIADDSGLSVEALNGEPGIYSARYGGDGLSDKEKNLLLLKKLKNNINRNAKFICVITVAFPNRETYSFDGVCNGEILDSEVGDMGFGYDPIFKYEDGRPFGTLNNIEKNEISHRGKATRKLLEFLRSY